MDVLSKPRFADGIHIESEDVQEELLEIVESFQLYLLLHYFHYSIFNPHFRIIS